MVREGQDGTSLLIYGTGEFPSHPNRERSGPKHQHPRGWECCAAAVCDADVSSWGYRFQNSCSGQLLWTAVDTTGEGLLASQLKQACQ